MTQKSEARKARDAEAKAKTDHYKNNNCWDELNGIYEKCGHALIGVARLLSSVNEIPEITSYFDPRDAGTTISALNALRSDLNTFTTELAGIGNLHRHLKGGARDEDSFIQMTGIYDSYTNFQARYSQIIDPNFYIVSEQVNIALQRMEAAQAAAAATDPAVVTDAVARDIPSETKA